MVELWTKQMNASHQKTLCRTLPTWSHCTRSALQLFLLWGSGQLLEVEKKDNFSLPTYYVLSSPAKMEYALAACHWWPWCFMLVHDSKTFKVRSVSPFSALHSSRGRQMYWRSNILLHKTPLSSWYFVSRSELLYEKVNARFLGYCMMPSLF